MRIVEICKQVYPAKQIPGGKERRRTVIDTYLPSALPQVCECLKT